MSVTSISPNDQTLDAASVTGSEAASPWQPRIALVEGSGPQLSGETNTLLHARLRSASLVLCSGFAVFLAWSLVSGGFDHPWLLTAHAAVTLVLGASAGLLCRRCPKATQQLGLKQAVVFGLPAAYFLAYEYVLLSESASDYQYLPAITAAWLTLMFTYAMFIPNTWKRSAPVIAGLALAPLGLVFFLAATNPVVASLLTSDKHDGYFIEMTLMLGISAAACVFGVYTINALRQEAFSARQLGQYHLRQLIGKGGMGEVYLAEHHLLKRPCAIKLIRPDRAGDPRALARFEREVRATARLSHWNSVEVFDYGRTQDGTFYYVMEFLPGLSLAELVERHGPLPPERVIYLLRQTCDALAEAHGLGLLHRDIKPGNLFAAQRGGFYDVAKLLDFGLAKPVVSVEPTSDLTLDGSITGSPLYMSPEQATGDAEPDNRSDIYSLGAVAYYLLTGRPPFAGSNPFKLMMSHARDEPTPPSQVAADVPEDLEAVVLRCLAKQPDERFENVQSLAAALDDCRLADAWTPERAKAWWLAAAAEPQPESAVA